MHDHYTWGVTWIGIAVIIGKSVSKLECRRRHQLPLFSAKLPATTSAMLFWLWLGYSTGHLAKRDEVNLAPYQKIILSLTDATQNVLILGGIGSEKTTCAIYPLLAQLLDQSCGGLIFDIKGDFQKAVMTLADKTNRSVTLLGPNYQPINLLSGLTPEVAASFLKSIFFFRQSAA